MVQTKKKLEMKKRFLIKKNRKNEDGKGNSNKK